MNHTDKPFLTYEEQIQKLLSKHMVIEEYSYATAMLKKYGYYPLICGYKEPFKNRTTHNYVDGTRFEEIVNLYEFDSELRNDILPYILIVEKQIKEAISNTFCEKYGDYQNSYLDANNYNYSTPRNRRDINKLIEKLGKLSQSNKYPYINHARSEHNNVPLWVLFKAVPFGSASKMFELLKPSDKATIAKDYTSLNEGNIGSLLQIVSACRNVCAHSERIYKFRTNESIPILNIHNKMNIPRNEHGNECVLGQKDLFAVIISLRYLLDDYDFKKLKKRLIKTIENYFDMISKNDSHISPNLIMENMGFPVNWKNITRYKL